MTECPKVAAIGSVTMAKFKTIKPGASYELDMGFDADRRGF
jgi:hypothetical protein